MQSHGGEGGEAEVGGSFRRQKKKKESKEKKRKNYTDAACVDWQGESRSDTPGKGEKGGKGKKKKCFL